jgi:predicted deacylase
MKEWKAVKEWQGRALEPGKGYDLKLSVSESFSSMTVRIPLHIRKGLEEGPTVFVTAALHGDEINGTGAIRHLLQDPDLELLRGTLIAVPVLNILGFERHSRYLPDRRDLNRAFPGSPSGTLASRMADTIFREIVCRCDYGIDLHTAAVRRTNYPNIRADLSSPEVRRLAEAFGTEVVINGGGPKGALRREACNAGCPTIVMEGGEVWKVEPGILASAVRGVKNVLKELEMIAGEPERPDYQILVERSKWVRADRGGFLQFHIQPGEVVEEGQPLATNTTLLGDLQGVVEAPFDGIVVGMTTLPSTNPGEPVCNIARLPENTKPSTLLARRRREAGLEDQLIEELASNFLVVEKNGD